MHKRPYLCYSSAAPDFPCACTSASCERAGRTYHHYLQLQRRPLSSCPARLAALGLDLSTGGAAQQAACMPVKIPMHLFIVQHYEIQQSGLPCSPMHALPSTPLTPCKASQQQAADSILCRCIGCSAAVLPIATCLQAHGSRRHLPPAKRATACSMQWLGAAFMSR